MSRPRPPLLLRRAHLPGWMAAVAALAVACGACSPGTPSGPPRVEPIEILSGPAATTPADVAARLRADVEALHALGERSTRRPAALEEAARHIERALAAAGLPASRRPFACDGLTIANIEVLLPGAAPEAPSLLVGAHYDSAADTAGADDNASGVAVLLELARRVAAQHAREPAFPARPLRLVAFVNEEPPHFRSESMGSLVMARELAARGESPAAMLALECLGYYDEAPGSQHYPAPLDALYPDTADFLAFVGDVASAALVQRCSAAFRAHGALACESAALPDVLPGIGWSDHWSFWQTNVPAVMVTDTALFRNPHYHEPSDDPDTLDFGRAARAADGLFAVLVALDTAS